jgi:hypothetical protein
MNKPGIFLPALALLAGSLCAFRGIGDQPAGYLLLQQSFQYQQALDTGGRTVSIDSAMICIKRYDPMMREHGFSTVAGEKIDIRLRRTRLISTGELFRGKGLIEWLNKTAAEYEASGRTLMIDIQFGIYDSAFLNTYEPDPQLRKKNLDRVAIFLIPYDETQLPKQKGIRALNAAPPPPPPGDTGYDLGSVHP